MAWMNITQLPGFALVPSDEAYLTDVVFTVGGDGELRITHVTGSSYFYSSNMTFSFNGDDDTLVIHGARIKISHISGLGEDYRTVSVVSADCESGLYFSQGDGPFDTWTDMCVNGRVLDIVQPQGGSGGGSYDIDVRLYLQLDIDHVPVSPFWIDNINCTEYLPS